MKRMIIAAAAALAVAGSASAAPVGLLVVHQTVADYAKWRPGFDAHKPARDAAGLTDCQVRQAGGDPNNVYVACQMSDLAKAKAFTESPGLADAMKHAGVTGKPEFIFLSQPL